MHRSLLSTDRCCCVLIDRLFSDFFQGAFAFYEFIDTQALDAKRVLCETLLPAVRADAELYTKFEAVLIALHRALGVTPQSHPDKMNLALWVIRGSYGMVKLAHDVYPSDGLPPLPGEQAFISMCLGLGLADEEQSPPPMILGQAVAPLLSPLLGSKLLGPEVPEADHLSVQALAFQYLCTIRFWQSLLKFFLIRLHSNWFDLQDL